MSRDRRSAALALLAALAAACEKEPEPAPGPAPAPASRLDVELERPVQGDPAAAAPLIAQARGAIAVGRADEARERISQALESDPANLGALVLRGQLFLAKGLSYDPSRALVSFRVALLVDPTCVPARVGEAVARAELEDDENVAVLARALLADGDAKRAALDDAQRAALHRSLGGVALRAARFDEALAEADHALAKNPGDRPSAMLRAEALERLDRNAEADEQLVRAIDVRPEDSTAHFVRSRVLRRLGRADDAARELRIYRALRPFEEEASKAFATDWTRRIELRRELIAAYPQFRRARHHLVRELTSGAKYEEATAELDRLLAEQPGDAEAWYLLAKVRARKGDHAGARDAAERMLAAAPLRKTAHADLLAELAAIELEGRAGGGADGGDSK